VAEPSTSKPALSRSRKINKLLKRFYELEYLEKQVKKKNTQLIDKNVELYDMSQEVKEKHDKTLERNKLLMRENTKLYRRPRLLRLKMKQPQTLVARHSGLETLAKMATSLEKEKETSTQYLEVSSPVRGGGTSPKAL
jgi:hypothetical protein